MNTGYALTVSILSVSGLFLLHNLTQPNALEKFNRSSFLAITSAEQLAKENNVNRFKLGPLTQKMTVSRSKSVDSNSTKARLKNKQTLTASFTESDSANIDNYTYEANLWSFKSANETDDNGIPFYRLQTHTQHLKTLKLQQDFLITLPEINIPVQAIITSHYQATPNVDVFEGPITNLGKSDHLILSRGKIETHIIVSTEKGVFTGRIDNTTGETTLVNESYANPELGSDADFINAPIKNRPEIPIPKPQSLSVESTL